MAQFLLRKIKTKITFFLIGYATPPGTVNGFEDGVVINYLYFGSLGEANTSTPYNLGKTLTHEIGHYFNLFHPWGLQKYECEEDDLVDDTPIQYSTFVGCPSLPQISCGQASMTMNFMNEVDDNCMFIFTHGQVERMHTSIQLFRSGLLENSLCSPFVDSNFEQSIQILPNPAREWVHVKIHQPQQQIAMISFYDNFGRFVKNENVIANQYYPLNISDFPKGFYYLRVSNQDKNQIIGTKKLIVQ